MYKYFSFITRGFHEKCVKTIWVNNCNYEKYFPTFPT